MNITVITLLLLFCIGSVLVNLQLMRMISKQNVKKNEIDNEINNFNLKEQTYIQKNNFLEEKLKEKDKTIEDMKNFYNEQIRLSKNECEKRLQEQKQDYEKLIQKLEHTTKESFVNIANQILEQKGKTIQEQSLQNIHHLLQPFKTDLQGFKDIIHKTSSQSVEQIASLKTQIEIIHNTEKQMMQTAENLTNALKSENKTQGNWGEMIVRKILEDSGLKEGVHFVEQGKDLKLTNEEGKREQPDFIINLPNGKHIILDAKTSLTAYERFCTTHNENDLKSFIISVKNHIKELSEKKYHENQKLNTPDFTIMFIPIEGAYFLAAQNEKTIWEFAWQKRIALCCPSNLFPMLKTIANIWEIDTRNKNVEKVIQRAGQIYKKFEGFVLDLQDVGKNLQKASRSFEEAEKKFISGHGSLNSQFKDMQELGQKASIQIEES